MFFTLLTLFSDLAVIKLQYNALNELETVTTRQSKA